MRREGEGGALRPLTLTGHLLGLNPILDPAHVSMLLTMLVLSHSADAKAEAPITESEHIARLESSPALRVSNLPVSRPQRRQLPSTTTTTSNLGKTSALPIPLRT